VRPEGLCQKNSSNTIGNRTHDLPACSVVPQPTALPRAPIILKCPLKPSNTVTSLRRQTVVQRPLQRTSRFQLLSPLTLNVSLYIIENQLAERATQSTWSIRQIKNCVSACNLEETLCAESGNLGVNGEVVCVQQQIVNVFPGLFVSNILVWLWGCSRRCVNRHNAGNLLILYRVAGGN
jgi:hypothetical protein